MICGGHLEFKFDLDLEYKEYCHYLQEHMNSLSKGVILSNLDTYNKIIQGKRHNFIDFWHFFLFLHGGHLVFFVPGPLMIILCLSHNRASP